MWYIHTIDFYLAVKKNEIMKFKGKLVVVKNDILSEVAQTQEDKPLMIYLWILALNL